MKIKITTPILCSALLTQLVMLPDFLYSQSDFYRGKTIRMVHGRDAGGSGDLRVKALVPFLQKRQHCAHAIVARPAGRTTVQKRDGLALIERGLGIDWGREKK